MLNKLKEKFFPEPIFRQARIWSNTELLKYSHYYTGSVVNVSAWRDEDKRGMHYRDYFSQARSYDVTNKDIVADTDMYLDLEADLLNELHEKWDLVFNHTTLEHVFNVNKAFSNLCSMARECVVLVVPSVQQYHGNNEYEDYWRFMKPALIRMFEQNHMKVIHIAQGGSKMSQYILVIAEK